MMRRRRPSFPLAPGSAKGRQSELHQLSKARTGCCGIGRMSGRGVTSQALIPAIGRKLQELPLHRVDPGYIGCNEMIAASFAGDHLKIATSESRGGTRAAKMDEGGKILLLLRACRYIACAGENRGHVAVQIYGC